MIRGLINCRIVFTYPLLEKPKECGNELIRTRIMDSDGHRAKGICFGKRLTMLLTASHLAHSYPMAHF